MRDAVNENYPIRGRPAHKVLPIHGVQTVVFLTVCTHDRQPALANDRSHRCLTDVWSKSQAWLIGRYMVMPDHVHLFVSPGVQDVSIGAWNKYSKRLMALTTGVSGLWQDDYWDTTLRAPHHYDEKWYYVVENPVRKGLVRRSEDWPYQGELNVLKL